MAKAMPGNFPSTCTGLRHTPVTCLYTPLSHLYTTAVCTARSVMDRWQQVSAKLQAKKHLHLEHAQQVAGIAWVVVGRVHDFFSVYVVLDEPHLAVPRHDVRVELHELFGFHKMWVEINLRLHVPFDVLVPQRVRLERVGAALAHADEEQARATHGHAVVLEDIAPFPATRGVALIRHQDHEEGEDAHVHEGRARGTTRMHAHAFLLHTSKWTALPPAAD